MFDIPSMYFSTFFSPSVCPCLGAPRMHCCFSMSSSGSTLELAPSIIWNLTVMIEQQRCLRHLNFIPAAPCQQQCFFFLSEPHQIASKFYENNDLLQRSCQPIIQNKPLRTFQISWAAGLYNLLLIWWPADTVLVYLVFPCSCWGTNNPNM